MKITETDYPRLCECLRNMRLAKGLTLKELSELSGVSLSFLSDIEHERADPSLETLNKIAKGLGASLMFTFWED